MSLSNKSPNLTLAYVSEKVDVLGAISLWYGPINNMSFYAKVVSKIYSYPHTTSIVKYESIG